MHAHTFRDSHQIKIFFEGPMPISYDPSILLKAFRVFFAKAAAQITDNYVPEILQIKKKSWMLELYITEFIFGQVAFC
jgi:hypothetical protein